MLKEIISLIVDTAAAILAAAFLLRFWAQAIRVRPPEAIARFMFKASNWLILPLRKVLPNTQYDWSCVIGTLFVSLIAALPPALFSPYFSIKYFAVAATLQVVGWVVYGFTGLMIIEALLSWINPHAPIVPFIAALNAPLLRPLRRLIPSLGGLDLSVLIAIILLRIIHMVANSVAASLL